MAKQVTLLEQEESTMVSSWTCIITCRSTRGGWCILETHSESVDAPNEDDEEYAFYEDPYESTSEVIKTKEDLKSVLLGAKSIAFSDPERGATVGLHFLKVIKALGIESEVLAKSKKAREGLQTMKWVSEGMVDLGVTQVSEIMQADPQSLVGPFPEEFDLSTRYALWLKEPQAPMMKAMVVWLKSKEARELMKAQGLRALE
jgi:ABC-type molybdate transport system substrate-binding protein